jgi:hypothetical protein
MATEQPNNAQVKRDDNGRWAKGGAPVSPGRPVMDPEFKALCRKHCPVKLRAMLKRFNKLPERVQVQIIDLMAGYAYGKATQVVDGEITIPILLVD